MPGWNYRLKNYLTVILRTRVVCELISHIEQDLIFAIYDSIFVSTVSLYRQLLHSQTPKYGQILRYKLYSTISLTIYTTYLKP